jgi:hypothetical protein
MKIGFVGMPASGHLDPMTALARRLQSRGNEVVFIGVPDVEPFARAAGLNFIPFCEDEFPTGSIAKLYGPVSKLHGFEATRLTIREMTCALLSAGSKHLPQKLAETGVEALVIDTIHQLDVEAIRFSGNLLACTVSLQGLVSHLHPIEISGERFWGALVRPLKKPGGVAPERYSAGEVVDAPSTLSSLNCRQANNL